MLKYARAGTAMTTPLVGTDEKQMKLTYLKLITRNKNMFCDRNIVDVGSIERTFILKNKTVALL
jgi:hypothetical protein